MLSFEQLAPLLGSKSQVDVACPACSPFRKAQHRKLKVLRIWAVDDGMVSFYCAHCEAQGYARSDDDERGYAKTKEAVERARRRIELRAEHEAEQERLRVQRAHDLWCEAGPLVKGTWAWDYVHEDRKLKLCDAVNLRAHPRCPFPDSVTAPALLVAFTRLADLATTDPLNDPPIAAIHRIRGRGHLNKAMLGPVKGAAMMLDPPHLILSDLSVCEGVETGLAIRERSGGPLWALGSAGAIERFPVIRRVRRLRIWSDNDEVGKEAARVLGERYAEAGREVIIRSPEKGGDYAG